MEIGHKLKDIKLIVDDKTVLTEKDLLGKKVIIYFYPKDDTPGCTTEAIDFTSFKNQFDKLDVNVIGVSKDSVEKHSKFIQKHNLEVKLASDEDGNICKTFKVWVEKSMYGKSYMGIERSTFLIDPDGKVTKVWRKVKIPGHAEDVLAQVQAGG